MRRIQVARILAALAIAAVALGVRADKPEKPPKGMGKYLIVLWDPGTPVPGKKDERIKKVPEPDIEKQGGRVLSKNANRRVVFLPYAAAKQLRRHEAVSYVQRIWTGEPFEEWNETDGEAALRAGGVSAEADPTFSWDKSYAYDADGNVTDIGDDEFAYDDMGRLVEATVNGAPETYAYDGFGNLTGIGTPSGGVAVPTDPASNRMIGETYDAAGNVTSRGERGTYTYDSLNMIVEYEALPNISRRRVLYDADDERIGTIIDSSLQRWTLRGLDGQILREFKGDSLGMGMVWSWEQDHVRGEGQLIGGELVTWGYYAGPSAFTYGGKRHYHLDPLGSVRVVTNQAGRAIAENDFFPFGASRTKQYQEQLNYGDPHADGMRFAGHWRDFMGHPDVEGNDYIDYMHARHYDPSLGRFLSPDPVLGNLLEPQSWNRYAYVLNNPMNFVDPSGLVERRPGEQIQDGDTCDGKIVDGWCTGETITVEADTFDFDEFLKHLSNFSAGFGDSLTFGLTGVVREKIAQGLFNTNTPVDPCSKMYAAGEYTEVGLELVATAGSSSMRVAASQASRRAVRSAARSAMRGTTREAGKVLHHANPLFGHPGGAATLFPTGGLPASIHSGAWNIRALTPAQHLAAHRYLRTLEKGASLAVNPGMTAARAGRNMAGQQQCGN